MLKRETKEELKEQIIENRLTKNCLSPQTELASRSGNEGTELG